MSRPLSAGHAAELERIRSCLVDRGLVSYRAEIEAGMKAAVGLRTRLPTSIDLAVGATRFGGEPDVPASFEWPQTGSSPVMFIAQIRLANVRPFDVDAILPGRGLLSIFAEASCCPAYAFHFPEGTQLARRPLPTEAMASLGSERPARLRASGVDIEPQFHLPATVDWPICGPLSPRDAQSRYAELRTAELRRAFPPSTPALGGHELASGGPAVHQMLGDIPPDLTYADIVDGSGVGPDQEVLLAMATDHLVGMEFGDAQRVWLLGAREQLRAGDFSKLRCGLST